MELSGWGQYPRIDAQCCTFESQKELRKCLQKYGDCIVHGSGRSYGDSALHERVILSERFNKILNFNEKSGIVTCESGVTLEELIDAFIYRGWFLAITPGTKFVTVGGAIASDVHGKNHHKVGCFSTCVKSFRLMLPGGKVLRCSRDENREFFSATCGGMGLTGVILSAEIQLIRVKSANIHRRILKAGNLEQSLQLFGQYADASYSIAWIDCLAKGKNMGRALFIAGEHADDGTFRIQKKKKLTIPFEFPCFAMNKYSISLFNALYFHVAHKYGIEGTTTIDRFFYPLDAIQNWNRVYGKKGFTQYQFVLPKEKSFEGLRKILNTVSDASLCSFLAVLKLFGPENGNYLSFPMNGYTLALDFKIEAKLFPLLDALDKVVIRYGGRINLTKDVRLTREVLEHGYPRLDAFCKLRREYKLDKKYQSMQSRRLNL
jgi:decaprenylphospho-beta-D-ribofuranose 2-oxidase